MNAYVERQQLTGSHFITVLHLSAVSGRLNMRHDLVDRRQKLVKIITIFILWSERRSLGGRQTGAERLCWLDNGSNSNKRQDDTVQFSRYYLLNPWPQSRQIMAVSRSHLQLQQTFKEIIL